jgi:hypothetical protein
LAALAVYDVAYLAVWLARGPQPPFDDFFGLWSFGRFAARSGVAVYDPQALAAFQHALDPSLSGGYPCPYPPPFLLALVPVGAAPLAPAFVLWMTTTSCAYLAATLGRRWRSLAGLALPIAPTSLLTVVAGQNGFLTAAFLLAGLRTLNRSPWLAGVVFGLLAYKPQFGVVVPVVLIATRSWRPLIGGAVTGCVAMLAASLAFGAAIWGTWLDSLSTYGRLLAANVTDLYHAMPTFMANLLGIGAPIGLAAGFQVILALVILAIVSRTSARAWDERSVVIALLASLIVTPYAFTYELPILTAALVLEARRRRRLAETTGAFDLVAAGLASAFPLVMSAHEIPFVEPVLIVVLFGRIAWRRPVSWGIGPPSPMRGPEAA